MSCSTNYSATHSSVWRTRRTTASPQQHRAPRPDEHGLTRQRESSKRQNPGHRSTCPGFRSIATARWDRSGSQQAYFRRRSRGNEGHYADQHQTDRRRFGT